MEQTATQTAVQYGVLGVVALVFAWAIVHLFKVGRLDKEKMETERKDMEAERKATAVEREAERKAWAVEREQLKTEYERKHREIVEDYSERLEKERDSNRTHEDLMRTEFAEMMEQVAKESGQSAQALVDMMQKFLDRFVGRGR
jgi:flagellar biosynthesis GTPase FlhF